MSAFVSRQSAGSVSLDLPPSDIALKRAVDQVPETQGMGIVFIVYRSARTLRATPAGQSTVVIEYRPSPTAEPAEPAPRPRNSQTSPAMEWIGLGLNCGGAVLSWVGVVGTAASAPVTGGQSLWGTAVLWGGALASSGACGVSMVRVGAMVSGKGEINEKMDKSATYVWTMRGLDVVGILGVGGAFKDIMETRDALDASGLGWRRAMSGPISRPQRRVITNELALLGSKRVAAPLIEGLVKQRLLAAIAAAIGMGSSAAIGATHDFIIWIVTPSQGQ